MHKLGIRNQEIVNSKGKRPSFFSNFCFLVYESCGEAAHKLSARMGVTRWLVHKALSGPISPMYNLLFIPLSFRIFAPFFYSFYTAINTVFLSVSGLFVHIIHSPYKDHYNSYKGDY